MTKMELENQNRQRISRISRALRSLLDGFSRMVTRRRGENYKVGEIYEEAKMANESRTYEEAKMEPPIYTEIDDNNDNNSVFYEEPVIFNKGQRAYEEPRKMPIYEEAKMVATQKERRVLPQKVEFDLEISKRKGELLRLTKELESQNSLLKPKERREKQGEIEELQQEIKSLKESQRELRSNNKEKRPNSAPSKSVSASLSDKPSKASTEVSV